MAIVDGVAYWASVTTPNTTYEPVYSINVVVDNEVANDFRSRGFTVKDKEEGPTIVVKRKVHGPNGMIRTAPKLIDNMKNEMDCQIGNGSTVRVQYKEWEITRQGTLYKGLDLQAVQVKSLVSFSKGGLDEFDIIEDEEEVDEL
jgi:hypothetical protein